ncbi:MAG: hypothetical protein Q4615_13865, partial [Paracoccus aminovorans]|nr:hypothetical protein [Paracoccus aminovorans]
PDLPELPNLGGVFERAQNFVEKFARGIRDIGKVPTGLDMNGANIGMVMAKRAAIMNRLHKEDYTFYEICLIIMEGSPTEGVEGFMNSSDLLVRQYAESVYFLVDMMFANAPQDRLSYLHQQFSNAKAAAKGLVRATNAALLAAYTVAVAKEELPLGPLTTINRKGKAPADYASLFRAAVSSKRTLSRCPADGLASRAEANLAFVLATCASCTDSGSCASQHYRVRGY